MCEHTKEISEDRECTDAQSSEGSGSGDVPVQFLDHGLLTMTPHHHLLFLQLLGDLSHREDTSTCLTACHTKKTHHHA